MCGAEFYIKVDDIDDHYSVDFEAHRYCYICGKCGIKLEMRDYKELKPRAYKIKNLILAFNKNKCRMCGKTFEDIQLNVKSIIRKDSKMYVVLCKKCKLEFQKYNEESKNKIEHLWYLEICKNKGRTY